MIFPGFLGLFPKSLIFPGLEKVFFIFQVLVPKNRHVSRIGMTKFSFGDFELRTLPSIEILSPTYQNMGRAKSGSYRKFSNRGATPYKGAPPLFEPRPSGFLDVFGHISAKNCPVFIL